MKTTVKWIVRVIGGFIILMLILGAVTFFSHPDQPPTVDEAQYAFQTYSQDEFKTPSRIYFSNDVELVDNCPVIGPGYWDFTGKVYNYHKESKTLPENTKMVKR